jgi:hypothetical protein
MPKQIFISYRRDDEPGMATALYFQLERVFTAERIFMDVEGGISAGHDFVRIIQEQVAQCDVMLVVIGRGWLTATDDEGQVRLDNPEDFVRIEVDSAMQLDKLIIPVLINKTDMPRMKDLPDALKPLARRNAVRLTQERVRADMEGIVKVISQALADIEQERAAAEGKSWDRVKDTNDLDLVTQHLLRFPDGPTSADVRARQTILQRESAAAERWRAVSDTGEVGIIDEFLRDFPDSAFDAAARQRLNEIYRAREEADWEAARGARHPAPLLSFLRTYPRGVHAQDALEILEALPKSSDDEAWAVVKDCDEPIVLRAFVAALPNSQHLKSIRARLLPGSSGNPPSAPQGIAALATPASAEHVNAPNTASRLWRWAPIGLLSGIEIFWTVSILSGANVFRASTNRSPLTGFLFAGALTVGVLALVLRYVGAPAWGVSKSDAPKLFRFQVAGTLTILGWMLLTQAFAEPFYHGIITPNPFPNAHSVRQGQALSYLAACIGVAAIAIVCIRYEKIKWLRYAFNTVALVIGIIAATADTNNLDGGVAADFWISVELNLYGGLALVGFALIGLYSDLRTSLRPSAETPSAGIASV